MIIIPEKTPQEDKFLDLDSAVTDGIYVAPSTEHKIYHLRETKSKSLSYIQSNLPIFE